MIRKIRGTILATRGVAILMLTTDASRAMPSQMAAT
jgi:hypothetical protein